MALFGVSGKFIEHPRIRFRVMESELVSFGEKSTGGLVVSRTSHAMDTDGQRVFLLIGFEVGGGNEAFSNQGPRLLFLGHARA